MQTLLPFADFEQSARVLDWRRLGKQRSDNIELLERISGWKLITKMRFFDPQRGMRVVNLERKDWKVQDDPVGWTSHPCQGMWTGHEMLLRDYQYWITTEWVARGYKDTCWEKFCFLWNHAYEESPEEKPKWLGDSMFHLSYQSLLVRKDPDFYSELFPGAPDNLAFQFPV